MAKFMDPKKKLEMVEIAQAYNNYKGLRKLKRQQYDLLIAQEMEEAHAEFGTYLQSKIDRSGYSYKFSVSDLMDAMGTTDRKTVNDFLGDARDRAKNRFLDEVLSPGANVQIILVEDIPGLAAMGVMVDDETYRITYRTTEGGARVFRWQPYTYVETEDGYERGESAGKFVVRNCDPYGSDIKEKGAIPDWVDYAVNTDEWKTLAPMFWN